MWPFRRRTPPEVDLTDDAYRRWLRAWRPPLVWFLGQPTEDQEGMAAIGDEHTTDLVIAAGYAIRDPELAEAGIDAGQNVESEEVLARRVAASLVSKILGGAVGPARAAEPAPAPAPVTMAGIGKRRSEAVQGRQAAKDRARSLFGRAPDSATKRQSSVNLPPIGTVPPDPVYPGTEVAP